MPQIATNRHGSYGALSHRRDVGEWTRLQCCARPPPTTRVMPAIRRRALVRASRGVTTAWTRSQEAEDCVPDPRLSPVGHKFAVATTCHIRPRSLPCGAISSHPASRRASHASVDCCLLCFVPLRRTTRVDVSSLSVTPDAFCSPVGRARGLCPPRRCRRRARRDRLARELCRDGRSGDRGLSRRSRCAFTSSTWLTVRSVGRDRLRGRHGGSDQLRVHWPPLRSTHVELADMRRWSVRF